MAWTTSSEQERMIVDSALVNLRLVLKARYIAYVLDNMTEQDAMVWFVVSRPFHEGFSRGGTLMDDYNYYATVRSEDIIRVRPLHNYPRYSKMGQMIVFTNMSIKREIEPGADIDRIFWHLERLDAVVWWLFCKHRNADYVDDGGGQATFEEYELRERARERERDLARERERARERARERELAQVRPTTLQTTHLQYDLEVEDTAVPDDEEPCVVCLANRRIVTAVPCAHKVTCGICSAFVVERMQPDHMTGLHPCPMCRIPVQYFEIRSETNQ
jgi:hypothetical protein